MKVKPCVVFVTKLLLCASTISTANVLRVFFAAERGQNVSSERFAQFQELDATLQFILSPHTIQFKNLE